MNVIDLGDSLSHPIISSTLAAAGWSTDRRIDISRWQTWYSLEGYEPDETTFDILRSFGGLTLEPPRLENAYYRGGRTEFEPELAADGESPRIHEWEPEVGELLWPIGEWVQMYILLNSPSGAIYAEAPGHGFGVLRLGVDFADALRSLIIRDRPPEYVVKL